ncbi:hypothetical protein EXS54_02825 [Patescibacteria group bacterium]|nr:hypothetical protein [Patescibacteria group bacterium]
MRRTQRGIDQDSYELTPRLEVLVERGSAPPRLGVRQIASLKRAMGVAWSTYRAKIRRDAGEEAYSKGRNRLLKLVPLGRIRGFRFRRGGQWYKVLVTDTSSSRVVSPEQFVADLGTHAGQVITKLSVPPVVFSDPTKYAALINLIKGAFGEDVASQLMIEYKLTELKKLEQRGDVTVSAGVLEASEPSWSLRINPDED